MKMAKIRGKCKRSADDNFLVLIQDFITTTNEITTGALSMRTNGWLEATDMLACARVKIGENRFLIMKNTPFEPLTLDCLLQSV